jgi:acetolactate synthase-1/3 small subunit
MLQSLSVLVENRAGVLTRVANLFARRGFNIESLAVGTTQNPSISRISITVDGDQRLVDQITKQLHKLPDVLIVRHLTPEDHFSRELVFVKVRCTAQNRGEVLQVVDIFRGHVIDVSPNTLTIELTGNDSKIKALQELLQPYGILELVRTGTISIERGDRIMNVEIQD